MIAAGSQGFSKNDADIQRLCGLGGVSRIGYYRRLAPHAPLCEDAELSDLIQPIALNHRHYGYRRVTHELRRQGLIVNAKRVARLILIEGGCPALPRIGRGRRMISVWW